MSEDFILEQAFHGKEFDEVRALAFGFTRTERGHVYARDLADGRFRLEVTVSPQGVVSGQITDARTHAPYILHLVDKAEGVFVGRVRAEYKKALTHIAARCFNKSVYKNAPVKDLLAYAAQKYGSAPEFLWKAFADYCVLRRKDNAKWYAVFMIVPRAKLGLGGEGAAEIVDLRAQEGRAAAPEGMRILPAYHMNKKTWFTVLPDANAARETLRGWLDASFLLAGKRK